MGYPPGIGTCLVTGDLRDFTAYGDGLDDVEVSVLLPVQLVDATDKVIVPAAAWTVETTDGLFSVELPFTDNPAVQPSGWAYTFYLKVPGQAPFMVQIPRSTGPTADISTLVPVGSSTPVWANAPFVPLADYTAKGDLVAGTGAAAVARVSVGADGTALVADSTQAVGMAFKAVASAPSWQFDVTSKTYGAKGDGRAVVDAAMTVSSAVLTSSSASFSNADQGKLIQVKGTAALGVTSLVTTIASVQSPTQVTLAAAAATTLSGALALWATDDTAAFQGAINDAGTHAVGGIVPGAGYGQVWAPPAPNGLFYGIGGALVAGGTTLGNGQLTFPIPATTGNKVIIDICGASVGAPVRHWQELVPNTAGSCIISFGVFSSVGAQITSLNNSGQAAVFSGPTGAYGYGVGAGTYHGVPMAASTYANLQVILRNLTIYTTHSAYGLTYAPYNLHGVANARIENLVTGTTGTWAGGDFSNPVTFANGASIGGVMPASGNNAACVSTNEFCMGGYTYGPYKTEHTKMRGLILYCWAGFCPVGAYGDGGSPTGAVHGITADLDIEGCTWVMALIGAGAGGVGPQVDAVLDLEEVSRQIRDQSSGTALAAATGNLVLKGQGGTVSTTGPTGMVIRDELQPIGVVSPVALTLGTAAQNPYGRPAKVLLAGGTLITDVKISAQMGGASAPAMTTYYSQASGALPLLSVPVGPYGWIQVDGTGTAPTTNTWALEA